MRFNPLLVLRLAIADLWAERVLGLCTLLGLSAVLAPLMVLAGLRAGVIDGLRQAILEDPHAREIVTASNRSFPAALLESLRTRPDVAFLAPRTRTLAAELLMEKPGHRGDGARLELIPSDAGDPLLPQAPTRPDRIVLSAAAAARLDVTRGAILIARLARILNGHEEVVPLSLTVQDIAPPSAFSREGAFVTVPFAVTVEDFQDGVGPAPAQLATLPEPHRPDYAGFRLYADRLADVPELDAYLRGTQHIDVVSRAADVERLTLIDRNLRLLFFAISGLGGLGFLVSLGAGLWANVERKRHSLALLRFLGLRTQDLCLIPMVQAALLGLGGSFLAVAGAETTAWLINTQLAFTLELNRALCVISPHLVVRAVCVTVLGAVIVAGAASTRAASIEAWEGVTAI